MTNTSTFARPAARFAAMALATLALALTTAARDAHAQPGTLVTQINVPVQSSLGVCIAADCNGNLYYTNYQDPTLYVMNKLGNLLATHPLVEVSGTPVTIGEMAWDNNTQVLWGVTDDEDPRRVFSVAPLTGIATYRFTMPPDAGFDLVDGCAYDAGDNSLWISPDVSTVVYHFTTAGASLGSITPLDASGNPLGDISGVSIGLGNIMYLGRNGHGEIVQVNKTTGGFISSFFSPGGRDEGLECDRVNFAPKTVLWSKDAYNNTVSAIEIDPLTCACGGVVPTRQSTWGAVKTLYR